MASFDLSAGSVSLSSPASPAFVCRNDSGNFTWIPNVECTGIAERAGISPPTATFRYLFDDQYRNATSLGWPGRIDDVWPIDASGAYVVAPDDRITVLLINPDGSSFTYLFDGFAQIPQADITPTSERATFTAVGVAAREFDNPIGGRTQRNGDTAGIQDTSGKSDVSIDLKTQFNPADNSVGDDGGYQPNKTPNNYDTDDGTNPKHPVFADERIKGRATGQGPDYWTISDAIKYILAEYNPASTYTSYPALGTLDKLFGTVSTDGIITADTVLTSPVAVRDFDANNRPWPEAVAELAGYAGFVMRWDLDSGLDGSPTTYLRFYRRDMLSTTPMRNLYLDEPGNSLANGSRNNVTALHLARDQNSVVNAWQVETAQKVVEVSVLLAPLYQPQAGDQTPTADATTGLKQFYLSNLDKNNATAEVRRKYRWYGVDETGDGHWQRQTASWVTTPFDFSKVFPPDDDGTPTYAIRYRRPINSLVAMDSKKRPLKAMLSISFDCLIPGTIGAGGAGDAVPPGFGGNNATFFPIKHGWKLLPDRLGIEVTAENPEDWRTGYDSIAGGVIRGVSWWAAPPEAFRVGGKTVLTNGASPVLMLTCVIEDDLRMPITAGKRKGSPTKFARWRVADARDHFRYASISESSENYYSQGGDGSDPLVIRDDTTAADNHARALRSAHEMPPLAGSVTLPGLVTSLEIGDRVKAIVGRDISLAQSAAASSGESPTLPVIVAKEYHMDGQFRTTIHLSDLRALRTGHDNAY